MLGEKSSPKELVDIQGSVSSNSKTMHGNKWKVKQEIARGLIE